MRIFTLIILFGTVVSFSFFSACRQEIDIDNTDTIEDLPVQLINTHIYGQVTNVLDEPLEDVLITIRNEEILTDANGYFSFDNIKADKNGTHIRASKQGYFQHTVTVYPKLNHSLFSSIVLNEQQESATMLSWQGGSIRISETEWLDVEPNTLVYDADGADFEGTAYFNLSAIPVQGEEFSQMVPGELTGLNESEIRMGMQAVALVRLEVTDKEGQKLRLAKGQSAQLTLKASDLNSGPRPGEIPMWHFEDEKGRWIASGLALLTGEDHYAGSIYQLNDWCFAHAFEVIDLSGEIQYDNTLNAAGHQISVMEAGDMIQRWVQTDDQGSFTAYVPKGRPLSLEVRNDCGVLVHQENLGSFDAGASIQLEISENTACRNLPLSGRLVDCEGNALPSGYLMITTEETTRFYQADANGIISGWLTLCEDEQQIVLSAGTSDESMATQSFTDLPVGDSLLIGQWNLCPDTEGSISLYFNDKYYLLNENTGFEFSSGSVLFYGNSYDIYFDCFISYFEGLGIYRIESETEADFLFSVKPNQPDALELYPIASAFETFILEIDKYIPGERIEGTVEGMVRDENHGNEEGMMYIRFSVPFVK